MKGVSFHPRMSPWRLAERARSLGPLGTGSFTFYFIFSFLLSLLEPKHLRVSQLSGTTSCKWGWGGVGTDGSASDRQHLLSTPSWVCESLAAGGRFWGVLCPSFYRNGHSGSLQSFQQRELLKPSPPPSWPTPLVPSCRNKSKHLIPWLGCSSVKGSVKGFLDQSLL